MGLGRLSVVTLLERRAPRLADYLNDWAATLQYPREPIDGDL
jgi:hypothetical protein